MTNLLSAGGRRLPPIALQDQLAPALVRLLRDFKRGQAHSEDVCASQIERWRGEGCLVKQLIKTAIGFWPSTEAILKLTHGSSPLQI
jgi:hypothetical protein